MGERGWYQEVLREPDPRRQLELNARNSRIVKERAGALMDVLRSAAPSQPELAELWFRIETDFYENQRAVVRSLHRKRALKRGLGVRRGTDILWTLS